MKIAAYLIEKIGSTVSGYFHPSLWLSESHELLVPQSNHGIEIHRPPRRDVACQQCDAEYHKHDKAERGGVMRANPIKKAGHEPCHPQSSEQTNSRPHQGPFHSFTDSHTQDIP